MAELVDAHGSGPCAFGWGSSPLLGTRYHNIKAYRNILSLDWYVMSKANNHDTKNIK